MVCVMISSTGDQHIGYVLFLIGAMLWLGPVLILTVIAFHAQRRYLQHYRMSHKVQSPSSPRERFREGIYILKSLILPTSWGNDSSTQSEQGTELGHDLRMVRRLALLVVAWIFIGWMIPFLLTMLAPL